LAVFFEIVTGTMARRTRQINSIIGKIAITEKQALKLGLEKITD
jgi:hypothetical protein